MTKNLDIFCSSFLIPKNPSWKSLSRNYKLSFNFLNQLNDLSSHKNKGNTSLNIFFASDLIEEFYMSTNFKKIKDIADVLIDLFKNKAKTTKQPVIVLGSFIQKKNIIGSALEKTSNEIFCDYFSKNIKKLEQKYSNIYFLNLDSSLNNFDYKEVFDNRNWYAFNCRLSSFGIEKVAECADLVLHKIYNPPKKLLVLDCDNTLWGGIIGEDGLEKISLGEDGVGKAFSDFQKVIKKLNKDGLLLAVCSKNNLKDVEEAFKHKAMFIKKKDIVSFKVNWDEKTKNIKQIANELNIGLDSIAFWDDNPLERDKVRLNLPEVLTVEPNKEVVEWPNQLRLLDAFSKFKITVEDKKKTNQYKARAKFVENLKNFKDQDKYLKTIKLKARKISITKSTINRAVQMINKTNQLNLRTQRYRQIQVENLNSSKNIIFLISLKDIYGDHGIIGLLIAKHLTKNTIFLDTFLVSCRVFGRNIETWMLDQLKKAALKKGFKEIYAEYIPSEKNQVAGKILENHNFKKTKDKSLLKLKKIRLKGNLFHNKIKNLNTEKAKVYE